MSFQPDRVGITMFAQRFAFKADVDPAQTVTAYESPNRKGELTQLSPDICKFWLRVANMEELLLADQPTSLAKRLYAGEQIWTFPDDLAETYPVFAQAQNRTVTLLSSNPNALGDAYHFIRGNQVPDFVSIEPIIEANRDLRVWQSYSMSKDPRVEKAVIYWDVANRGGPTFSTLLAETNNGSDLIDVVLVTGGNEYPPVTVQALHLNERNYYFGLSVETDRASVEENERPLIEHLFTLVDRVYKGGKL